ncbi:hypothetical protein OQA88_10727 [Cercophora sp. LCS_1]
MERPEAAKYTYKDIIAETIVSRPVVGDNSSASIKWASHIPAGAPNIKTLTGWRIHPAWGPVGQDELTSESGSAARTFLPSVRAPSRFNLTSLTPQKVNFSAETLAAPLKSCPMLTNLELRYITEDARLSRRLKLLQFHMSHMVYNDHITAENYDDLHHLTDLTSLEALEKLEWTMTCITDISGLSRPDEEIAFVPEERDVLKKLLPSSIVVLGLLDLTGNIGGTVHPISGLAAAEKLEFPDLIGVHLGGVKGSWKGLWVLAEKRFAEKGVTLWVPDEYEDDEGYRCKDGACRD